MSINTHTGTDFAWIAWKGGHNRWTVNFTLNGSAYDISGMTFTLNIRIPGSSTNALQLTQGSGLTNGGVTGLLTIDLTQTQSSTTLPGDYYFYELIYVSSSKTYAAFQGGLNLLTETNPGETTTSTTAEVSLAGTDIDAEITLIGSFDNSGIDGGSASSTYLADQNINGGGA